MTAFAPSATGWTQTPVTVTLTATGTNVPLRTFYLLDDGITREYSQPFLVTQEGESLIQFWSEDSWAPTPQVEPVRTEHIRIDGTAPAVGSNAAEIGDAKNPATAKLTLTATDGLSGLLDFAARLDSQPMTATPSGKLEFSAMAPGRHVLSYSAIDAAGNENDGLLEFTLRDTPSIKPVATSLSGKRRSGAATFNMVAAMSSAARTPLSGVTVALEQKTAAGWKRYGSAAKSDTRGEIAKRVTLKKAGKTSWRWRAAATEGARQAISPTIALKVR